jgi:hypothetical protein
MDSADLEDCVFYLRKAEGQKRFVSAQKFWAYGAAKRSTSCRPQ